MSKSINLSFVQDSIQSGSQSVTTQDDFIPSVFVSFSLSIQISLNVVPKGSINNISVLVEIMAWHRRGDNTLSERMLVSFLTHISHGLNELYNSGGGVLRHETLPPGGLVVMCPFAKLFRCVTQFQTHTFACRYIKCLRISFQEFVMGKSDILPA